LVYKPDSVLAIIYLGTLSPKYSSCLPWLCASNTI